MFELPVLLPFRKKFLLRLFFVTSLIFLSFSTFSQTIWYVNSVTGSDSNTGNSWSQAYATLVKAINSASAGSEIWVAKGIYKPGAGTVATETFTLKIGVQVYGGFEGTESSLAQRTDWRTNASILDGSNKSYHVITGVSLTNSTILDGFTVSGGNAIVNATVGASQNNGAGIYLTGAAPVLRNLIIKNNRANFYGAGLSNTGANLVLEDVTFTNNTSFYNTSALGGAMYNTGTGARLTRISFSNNSSVGNGGALYNTGANLILDDVEFSGNKAVNGGGLWNNALASLNRVVFSKDTATTAGGGMYSSVANQTFTDVSFSENRAVNGAGAYILSGAPVFNRVAFIANISSLHGGGLYNIGSTQLNNVVFSRNQVTTANTTGYGGGMYHVSGTTSLNNVTFSGNLTSYVHASTFTGAGLFRSSGVVNIYNSIFWGNKRGGNVADQLNAAVNEITNTIVEGGYATGSTLNRNPQFVNAATDNLNLQPGSVAIDAGDAGFLNFQDKDLAGNLRIVNNAVDLGAYESNGQAYSISDQLGSVITRGQRYDLQLTSSGGSGSNNWSVPEGSLPSGISLSSTGLLSGAPLINGSYSFVIRVTDGVKTTDRWYMGIVEDGPARFYVNSAASGLNSGGTWTHAFTSLQSAMALAKADDEIWIAKGIYNPGSDVASTFTLITGVKIYGGFAGTETQLSERDLNKLQTINETVLDGQNVNNHVVFNSVALSNTTLLDGFTITRGNATGTGTPSYGAGIYNVGGSAVFRNLLIKNNQAVRGGGAYNTGTSVFENITFLNNTSTAYGGGLWNTGAATLSDVVFRGNSATTLGGGMHNTSSPILNRVSFIVNTSVQHGGGLYTVTGSPKLDNVIFSRNTVTGLTTTSYGGGMYNASGTATLSNVSFSNNSIAFVNAAQGTSFGAGLFSVGTTSLYNSILWGNTRGNAVADQVNVNVIIANTIVQDGYSGVAGTQIFLGNPLFMDASADNLRLKDGSLAIDAGDNTKSTSTIDLAGNTRIVNMVDLGAYESAANNGLKVETADFAAISRGITFSNTLTAVGGNGNYTWSVNAGNLPPGLLFNAQGILSGIPVEAGVYDFVVSVTDGTKVGNRQYRMLINAAPTRLYVNHAASGVNQGMSWQHAFTDLQHALSIAQSGDEIWVSKGVYSPGSTVSSTYNLVSGVKIYGGFAGVETQLDQRIEANINTINETILNGNNTSYHVVTGAGILSNATLLDGFTITGGKTLTGTTGANYSGAGIYNSTTTVSAIFNNLIVKNNSAAYGGGIYNTGPASFINIRIRDNTSSIDGAGLYNSGAASFSDIEFNTNTATGSGAGMYTSVAVSLTNVVFSGNTATVNGGGLWNTGLSTINRATFNNNKAAAGGGMYNSSGNSILDNISFTDNISTAAGGGLYIGGSPVLLDIKFIRNSAGTTGGAVYSNGSPVIKKSSFISNTAVQHGGGLYIRGTTRIENSVLSDNKVTGSAYTGGGVYHYTGTSTLVNVTLSNNTTANAGVSGGGLFFRVSGTVSIYNSIFWGNTRAGAVSDQLSPGVTIANSIVEGGYATGTSILIGNPLFVNAAIHDLHLNNGSPAINSGDNSRNTSLTDLDDETRVYDGQIDLGAYENQGTGESVKIVQTSIAAQTRGLAINEQLTAIGGTGNYTWSVSSGTLPQGVQLTPQGLLKGIPVLAGSFTFVISVTDGTLIGSRQYTMQVMAGTARIYVSQYASGGNTGANWQNAFTTLTAAVNISLTGDEIWVGRGTYSPGTLVTSSFSLKEGVKWYGGFAGTENNLTERDTSKLRTVNETILTGNNKSYHVIHNTVALSDATVLDGFTISGGKTLTGSSSDSYWGGGIFNSLSTVAAVFQNLVVKNNSAAYGGGIYNNGKATFRNILIKDNTSTVDAAGMYTSGGPTLSGISFYNNIAVGNGGGLWNTGASELTDIIFNSNKGANGGGMFNSAGNALLTRVNFTANSATIAGGGLYTAGSPVLSEIQFINNTATTTGGGLQNAGASSLDRVSFIGNTSVQHGGGMWNSSNPKMDNAIFSRNRVSGNNTNGYGGAFYNHGGAAVLTNISFSNNIISYVNASTTTSYGGALYRRSGTVALSNSIFWGNTRGNAIPDQLSAGIELLSSIVQGGYATGISVMIGDPLFQDATADNLRLKTGSIAINAGDNTKLSKTKDIDGNPRLVDDQVDLGAYENQGGSGLTIQPGAIPSQSRGADVSIQMLASGGNGTYTWALQSGSLPTGLSISAGGIISGHPIVTGSYTFVLTVNDGTLIGNKQYTVEIIAGNARLYVKSSATGRNNGSNWLNAFTNLQTAIAQTVSGDEIWVAAGTYLPGTVVGSSFILKEGVKWYGGFAGTETTLAERDPAKIRTVNETVLSGNNISYHVLYNVAALTNATVVDGFSITGGKTASGTSGVSYYGGGFYNSTGNPLLSNLVFKNNNGYYGGAIYNSGSPVLNHVLFTANSTGLSGGAIYNTGTPILNDVVFENNTSASSGAAIFNTGSPTLDRVSFNANISVASGAAIYHSGGTLKISNSIFSNNRISSTSNYAGAGIYHNAGSTTLNNITFSNNTTSYVNASALSYGAALFFKTGSVLLNNSILWGNKRGNSVSDQLNAGITVNHAIIQNGYPAGTAILIGDPLFEDVVNNNLRLKAGSAAIDAGDNNRVSTSVDLLGNERIVNDAVDLGAIENAGGGSLTVRPLIIPAMQRGTSSEVQLTASGGNDNYTWSLQSGILPTGVYLTEGGLLSSAPTVPGSYTFVVSVTDGSLIGSRQYTVQVTAGAAKLYVDDSASGNNTGSNWRNAFTDLQLAIAQSVTGDEIWVAKGNYSPGTKSGSSFILKEGLKLYGGFAGTETNLTERDTSKLRTENETILDGSQGVPSYHVVFNTAILSNATVLDGFTISGGRTATGNAGTSYYGAGIYNTAGEAIFRNLLIKNNIAYYYGGGMYNQGAITLTNVIFQNNSTTVHGGGLYNTGAITLNNVSFINNTASQHGGGLFNSGQSILDHVNFNGNKAGTNGGGIYTNAVGTLNDLSFILNTATGNGGGLWSSAALSVNRTLFRGNIATQNGGGMFNSGASTFDRVSFISNSSGFSGGALYNSGSFVMITNTVFSRNNVNSTAGYFGAAIYTITGNLTLSNNTFSNNRIRYVNAGVLSYGAALYFKSGTVNAYNSIFWGNTRGNGVADQLNAGVNIVNGLIQDGYAAGVNVFIGNPEFENAANDDLRLKAGSAAIDNGDNTKNVTTADRAGNQRVSNDVIDLGAYENSGAGSLFIQPGSLPVLIRGSRIDQQFSIAEGTANNIWSLQSGTLPPGLIFTSSGILSGTPTLPGSYTFVLAIDNGISKGSKQFKVQVNAGSARLYVSSAATGQNTGSDWQNAFTDLQVALGQAQSGDELWVAKGIYSPGLKNSSYFTLKEGVKWYGGFSATETDLAQRDTSKIHVENETILDGSQGVPSYHVLYNIAALSSATVIDGFTVRGGKTVVNGTNYTYDAYSGAGLYNVNDNNSLIVNNVIFKDNRASNGAAIFTSGTPKFTNVKVQANVADFRGGGIYNIGTAVFENVLISGNTAQSGAGLYNGGTPALSKTRFNGNNASVSGGGIYTLGSSLIIEETSFLNNSATQNGGGMYVHSGDQKLSDILFKNNTAGKSAAGLYINSGSSTLDRISFVSNTSVMSGGALYNGSAFIDLTNSVFSRNKVTSTSASYGGGAYNYSGTLTLSNVSFANNSIAYVNTSTTAKYGGALYRNSGTVNLYNSILWGNTRGNGVPDQLNASVNTGIAVIQGTYAGNPGVIDADPWFVDAANDDLSLMNGSVAIDMGDNSKNITLKDIEGKIRLVNDIIDLGAYESTSGNSLSIQPQTLPVLVRGTYVSIPLTANPASGTITWGIASGSLPVGLTLTPAGYIQGIPVIPGIYNFIIKASDDNLRGTRQYSIQVDSGSARLHVHSGAAGSNNGSDWANAFTDLQTAISQSLSGDEIWVAKGSYSPGLKVTSSFTLKEGVKWYGGFAATETNLTDRDLTQISSLNETILDGSQGIASYHVIYNNTAVLSNATVIDGFTISGGRSLVNGYNYTSPSYLGGGLYDGGLNSSPILRNLVFKNNRASSGGAIFTAGAPLLNNIVVAGNTAAFIGGGIYSTGAGTFTDLTFTGNTAQNGGGWYNAGSSKLKRGIFNGNTATTSGGGILTIATNFELDSVTFINNAATQNGGGIYASRGVLKFTDLIIKENRSTLNGGGMFMGSGTSSVLDRLTFIANTAGQHGGAYYNSTAVLSISNSIFSRNAVTATTTYYGGAIYVNSGVVTLSNNTFSNNSIKYVNASAINSYGGAIYRRAGTVNLNNSVLWGNIRGNGVADQLNAGINTVNSLIKGGYATGTFIVDQDPEFTNALADDLSLSGCSPAINVGSNTYSLTAGDLFANTRVASGTVDMGAIEYQGIRLEITSIVLPEGNRGTVYTHQFSASGGTGNYTYSVTYGKLPDGLSLSSSGLLTGNPIVNGTYIFNIAVKDGVLCGNRVYQMDVVPGTGVVRIYVNAAAMSGMNNGSGWDNAYVDLQNAMNVSQSGDEIWVAKGSYSPGNLATSRFTLKADVRIFGGFGATESDLAERDTSLIRGVNETILDGSKGVPSYHIVFNDADLTGTTVLDGFTISGGKTLMSGTVNTNFYGAGFYNSKGSPHLENMVFRNNAGYLGSALYNGGSPVLTNTLFKDNTATSSGAAIYSGGTTARIVLNKSSFINNTSVGNGGAVYIASGIPEMSDVYFNGNKSTGNYYGGAVYNRSAMVLNGGIFINNSAYHGGAMYTTGNPVLNEVSFKNNQARGYGGAMFLTGSPVLNKASFIANTAILHGGAVYESGNPTFNNAIFSRNSVTTVAGYLGGAIYHAAGILKVVNSTFSANRISYINSSATAYYGGAIYRRTGTVNVSNSIFWRNSRGNNVPDQLNASVLINNAIVQNGYSTGKIILTVDPQFADAANDDLTLLSCSPAINMGDNSKVTGVLTDFAGQNRINEGAVDLGAFENQSARITITSTLPDGTRGTNYNRQVAASGGSGTYSYSITYGKLPDGLSLNPSGLINGKPIAAGLYTFNIMVGDGAMCGNMLYQMNILPGNGAVRMYVNQAASSGMDNGSDWENGFRDLQKAFSFAMPGDSIWVAKGTYSPGNLARSQFVLKENVKVFGGFDATELTFDERDTLKINSDNETILTGSVGTASYHVVYNIAALTSNTVLDGFTISGGRSASTSNTTSASYVGGGIYNTNINAKPIFRNLVIKDNKAVNGGGMYNTGSPQLYKVKFLNNATTTASGGGLYNSGNPVLTDVEFNGNTAVSYGGGLYSAKGTLLMNKVSFIANTTPVRGGGIYASGTLDLNDIIIKDNRVTGNGYGGGVYIAAGSTSTITNASFIGNSSGYSGAGLYNMGAASLKNVVFSRNSVRYNGGAYGAGLFTTTGTVSLTNVTFSSNTIAYINASTTASYGGALYRNSGIVNVINSIFWNNKRGNGVTDQINAGVTVSNSLVEKDYKAGTTILTADPQFKDAVNDDLSLLSCSPAINIGDNTAAASIAVDIAQNPRITHNTVDLGAYEFQGLSLENEEQTLADADQWKAYSAQISVGTGESYTYSLVYGLLPNGMILDANGILSGTPIESGEFNFGLALRGADICGTVKVKLTVKAQQPYIIQVYPPFPLPIDVKLGTDFANIILPIEAEVLLSDQSKIKLPVTWLPNDYNGNEIGKYNIIGILTLSQPAMNPNNLTATIKISVFDPVTKYIVAVDTLSRLNVLAGTPFNQLPLPLQVRVTYDTDSTENLGILWKQGVYMEKAGLYRIYGELVLTDPESNPADFDVSIDIHAQKNITSVEIFDDKEVALNTLVQGLQLPVTVRVTYHDLTTDNLIVQWDTSPYQSNLAGVYSLSGILALKSGTTNSGSITANIKVLILKDIISVTESTAMVVPFETAFADLNLPGKVHAVFNDGTEGEVDVDWIQGNYKDDKEGDYVIYGDLIPDEGISNTMDLMGKISVTVLNRPKNITSVIPVDSISVAFGTSFISLVPLLPASLKVTYHDLTEEILTVNWKPGEYNAQVSDTYSLTGDFILPANVVNMDSIAAEVEIFVERRFLSSVLLSDTLHTAYGTTFANLNLPEAVDVTYNDGVSGTEEVEWEEGAYQANTEGIYKLSGTLIPGPDIDNKDNLRAEINVIVLNRPPLIIALSTPDTVNVSYGTAFEDVLLMLPATVNADLDNSTRVSLPVTWTEGDYLSNETGIYQISGELNLPANLSNPNSLEPSIIVRVDKQFIIAVSALDSISVAYGTSGNNLSLPSGVEVDFNDNTKGNLTVNWGLSAYQANTPGLYTLTGILEVPEDIDNPDSLKATVQVRVELLRRTLLSVNTDSITVDFGTSFADIGFPLTATGIYDDQSQSALNIITWDMGNYDPMVAGLYELKGELQIPGIVDNPDSLTAILRVTVEQKYIIDVDPFPTIEVEFGTSYEQLNLADTAGITFNNQSIGTAGISWQPGTYNGLIQGEYILSGDLIPDPAADNKNNLQASVIVRVLDKFRILTDIPSDSISVEFGTSFSAIALPVEKEGLFDDASKENLPVVWDKGTFNETKPDTYEVLGAPTIPADAENPNDIRALTYITLGKKYIVSIVQPDSLTLPYGTPYTEIPLPSQISITFNDGSEGFLPVEWVSDTYKDSTGVYILQGSLLINDDLENPDDLRPILIVSIQALVPDVNSVALMTTIEVPFGTTFNQVVAGMPIQVGVIYNDNSDDELVVTWESDDFDGVIAGTYNFKGVLQLNPGTTNLNERVAEVKVIVSNKNIVSVTPSTAIQAVYGDEFSNLNLPEKVFVTFNDGSADELSVIWEETGYNPLVLSDQQLFGNMVLSADISNTANLKSSIWLKLLKEIITVDTIAKRSVVYGTPYENLVLPDHILVTYNDLSTELLAISWDSSIYNSANAGTIILEATLPLSAGTVNQDNLLATTEIVINKAELSIAAEHKIRNYGEANPELTFIYNGFVNNENESVLTVSPSIATTAVISSETGQYPIELQGVSALNYNISITNGVLHVVAVPLAPLPASGSLSVLQIADYMLLLGEVNSAERNAPFTLAFLNVNSHLDDKDPPYKVSDWYSYGPVKTAPVLVTAGIRNISTTTVSSGGYIHSDGGEPVTDRGLCWSINEDPTINDSKINAGAGTGFFSASISGLIPGTSYYVRAYATNSTGTVYGNELIFITKP